VLWRLQGEPDPESGTQNPEFIDVDENAYYAAAVAWAAEKGIVKGYGNGRFGPNDSIKRQDLALLFVRYADFDGTTLPELRDYEVFSDGDSISGYAAGAVELAYRAGIINGRAAMIFDPAGKATRAEFAAMLHRYMIIMQSAQSADREEPEIRSQESE
jgi:hypothetical protein